MNATKALYEMDFNLWLKETVNLLCKGDVEKLDLENLAEEIEDMENSRKDALESNLIRVLQHLLKFLIEFRNSCQKLFNTDLESLHSPDGINS